MRWFDGHLDLACLAENGRDLTRPLSECGGPWPPAGVCFPSLVEGGVRACLATVFTEADGDDAVAYPAGDSRAAHAAGLRQLDWYDRWRAAGLIAPLRPAPAARVADADPRGANGTIDNTPPIRVGILVEGADPIRSPAELPAWVARGVVAVGLTWARGSRFASGNSSPSCESGVGLTPLGKDMVRAIDDLGVVHDVSHLSDRALDDLLALARGPIVASHSNCRSIVPNTPGQPRNDRHLHDDAIREIARRGEARRADAGSGGRGAGVACGGVIGLNLCAPFIRPGLAKGDRPTIVEAIDHVEHVCALVGHRRAVVLGSDMDGGFSAEQLPRGIDSPTGFDLLADELGRRGWGDADIGGFAWGNWSRALGFDL
ncbi:MAG: membrane dipeptidase [Phycisphaerae bacterium]|nr:membrane dipeptidase [Phycisphaerae bacterium]